MIDKKFSPMMAIAAFMIGLGILAMITGAVTGSDAILFAGPFWFLIATIVAYRVRLKQAEAAKLPPSGIIDPSRFKP